MKDKLFSKKERCVLLKFKRLNTTSEEDEIILDRYACIGFVRYGFDWDNMEQTAILTDSGLKHLNR